MPEYDNTNTGALFKAREQKTDKHPGYTGSVNVEGREYWISAWMRESKAGEKFFSLSVRPKEDKAPPKMKEAPRGEKGGAFDDFEDDLPF